MTSKELDEAMRLAEATIRAHERLRCTSLCSAHPELPLARALLAVMPVYRAAVEWAQTTRDWPPDGDWEARDNLLEQAQNAFNAIDAATKEKP